MNEELDENLFMPRKDEAEEFLKSSVDRDSIKKIQVGIRLEESTSKMLAEIREWISNKPNVDFLGEEDKGSAVSASDTTLARFILESGIKALFSDMQNDQLIEEVAQMWKEINSAGKIHYRLSEKYGLPVELEKKLIVLGWKRSQEQAKAGQFSNVKSQAKRLDLKYEEDLVDVEELYDEMTMER